MRSDDVRDLLQVMAREQRREVKEDNIFDAPVRIYLMIKTMYQNYKKHHEL